LHWVLLDSGSVNKFFNFTSYSDFVTAIAPANSQLKGFLSFLSLPDAPNMNLSNAQIDQYFRRLSALKDDPNFNTITHLQGRTRCRCHHCGDEQNNYALAGVMADFASAMVERDGSYYYVKPELA